MIANAECSTTGLSIHYQDGTVERIKRKKSPLDDTLLILPTWKPVEEFNVTIKTGRNRRSYENH